MNYFANINLSKEETLERINKNKEIANEEISVMPSMTLSITNKCNSKCVICDYWKCKNIDYIPFELVKKWIPYFKKLNTTRVTLTGGEPLVHPDWWKMAKELKENSIDTHLMTNGLLLLKEFDNILKYIDEVTVSIDGGTSEIYRAARGVDGFQVVTDGIKALTKEGKIVRIRSVLQRQNYQEVPQLIEMAKSVGASITFQQMDVYSLYAYGVTAPSADTREKELENYILTEEDTRKFDDIINYIDENYQEEIKNGVILDSLKKLRTINRYFRAVIGLNEFDQNLCNLPFTSAVIDSDLSLRPCFFLPGLCKLDHENLIQDINQESAKILRRQILNNERTECKYCVVARFRDFQTNKLISIENAL